MKRKISHVTIVAALTVSAFFIGRFTTSEVNAAEVQSVRTDNELVDMSTVVDFTANEDGLQLYFADGTGYYYER